MRARSAFASVTATTREERQRRVATAVARDSSDLRCGDRGRYAGPVISTRRALAALTLAGSLLVTAGCATMSPVQTDVPYQAADGVNLTLSKDYDVRSLLVVGGDKEGGPGRISGQFVNNTGRTATVTFATADGATVEADAPAGSTNLADEDLTLSSVPGKAGDLVTITISVEGSNDVLQIPLLEPTGVYQDLAPTS